MSLKLKPIPENIFVHTPTKEEAEELVTLLRKDGYMNRHGGLLSEDSHWNSYGENTCYGLAKTCSYCSRGWLDATGRSILSFAEFKDQYCEMTEQVTEQTEGSSVIPDEAKDLNLCELLKGHEGEEFYSLAHGDVMLDHISPTTDSCIAIKKRNGGIERFYRDGRWLRGGIVMLFPSRALYEQYPLDPYRAWLKWKEEQKKF